MGRVQRALHGISGVQDVKVDLEAARVWVGGTVDVGAMVAALAEGGYPAQVIRGAEVGGQVTAVEAAHAAVEETGTTTLPVVILSVCARARALMVVCVCVCARARGCVRARAHNACVHVVCARRRVYGRVRTYTGVR